MEKILKIFDHFILSRNGDNNFNPVFLIPITIVIISVFAVFFYGFKKADSPKLRNVSSSGSGNANNQKRKKRQTQTSSSPSQMANSETIEIAQREKSEKSTNKKDSINTKANPNPSKKQVAKSTTTAPTSGSKTGKTSSSTPAKNTAKAVKSQKPIKNSIVNDEDGEWITVITKKQKKQPAGAIPDLLIQAVAEAALDASKKGNDTKKTKKATNQAKTMANAKTKSSEPIKASLTETTDETIPTIEIDSGITNTNGYEKGPITIIPESSKTSVVFEGDRGEASEDLDDAWTDTKSQRKNKKRALRE